VGMDARERTASARRGGRRRHGDETNIERLAPCLPLRKSRKHGEMHGPLSGPETCVRTDGRGERHADVSRRRAKRERVTASDAPDKNWDEQLL
jgi:hypothetical protein